MHKLLREIDLYLTSNFLHPKEKKDLIFKNSKILSIEIHTMHTFRSSTFKRSIS